jgi:hypothetical protein
MNRRSGVLDASARCEDCEFETDYYKNALANGAQHAQRTGHTVQCEQTIAVTYNAKATT